GRHVQCTHACPLYPTKADMRSDTASCDQTGTQSTRLTFALSGALLQQVMLGHARGKQDDANH
ncbi:MAG: hypothetical protein WAM12_00750, partial [Pseudolabrys sp.]